MSSIPLPALDVRPPQDPAESMQRLMAMRSLMNQQQLQQGQMQAQSLENQSRQLDLQNRQAGMKAMQEWDGKDYSQIPDLMAKHGADLNTVMQARTGIVKYQQDLATKTKTDLENLGTQNDHWAGLLDSVKKLPPEQQPQAFEGAKQEMISQYLKDDPQGAQSLSQLQYQGPQSLDLLQKNALGMKGMLDAALKGQQTATSKAQEGEATARAAEAQATTEKAKAEAAVYQQYGGTADSDKFVGDYLRAKGLPNTAANRNHAREVYKTMVPAFNFNLEANGLGSAGVPTAGAKGQPLSYADQIKSMGPKGGTVAAIIEGRQKPPGGFAQKTPYWQDVMNKVYAVDPQWNEQRATLRASFTQDKEIGAINTALGHVGVLGDAIDALQNGNVQVLNRIANAAGVQTGKNAITTFNTIVHRVGPELSKAYLGAGGSAGERGADEKDFDPAMGPQQLKSNVAMTAKLLRSKIASKEYQWDQNKAPSMPAFEDQFLMPEARQVLDKWSPQGGPQGGQEGGGAKAAPAGGGFDWSHYPKAKGG